MARNPGRMTVSIVRAARRTDAHNNQVPDWGNVTRTPVGGCDVQPGSSSEDLVNRDESLLAWKVFAPFGADVTATDRVEFRGVDYEVDGEPEVWGTGNGRLDHVVIALKRWEG